MDKRFASLPLSKEVLDRTPQEVVALLLRLGSRVDELKTRHVPCSLSLKLYIFTVAKSVLAAPARAAFCLFPGIVLGGDFLNRRECDAL
jgi:hypothetical protein